MINFRPLYDRVLVKRLAVEERFLTPFGSAILGSVFKTAVRM